METCGPSINKLICVHVAIMLLSGGPEITANLWYLGLVTIILKLDLHDN